MREQNAAGIVLCPVLRSPPPLVKEVQGCGIPSTVMVRTLGAGSYEFAVSDNEHGVYEATLQLVGKGHRRIAFLGGYTGVVLAQRLKGYTKAFKEAGIALGSALVLSAPPTREGGYEIMGALLERQPQVKATICYNDAETHQCEVLAGVQAALTQGRQCAKGDDNLLDAARSNPPLRTMGVRNGELGENAAALLLSRIEDPARPRQVQLKQPKLLVRQSVY